MNEETIKKLEVLATPYFLENYYYVYLKSRLLKGRLIRGKGATLITGSSYACNGIKEDKWNNAVNCALPSQDLYYDFKCAKEVISAVPANTYSKCYIIEGYYASCHDLTKAKNERELMVPKVYYPLFKDAHNWDAPWEVDRYKGVSTNFGNGMTEELKELIDDVAIEAMLNYGTYYNEMRPRGSYVYNLNGREWYELTEEEKDAICADRAKGSNKLWAHQETIPENKDIFKNYVHFLHLNNILPIFVVAPFTKGYNRYILSEMQESIMELLDAASGEVHFVDFNQCDLFDDYDFSDADHLNESGAKKMSNLLVQTFGR